MEIGSGLEDHLSGFSVIQTHPSRRFHLAVDILGQKGQLPAPVNLGPMVTGQRLQQRQETLEAGGVGFALGQRGLGNRGGRAESTMPSSVQCMGKVRQNGWESGRLPRPHTSNSRSIAR